MGIRLFHRNRFLVRRLVLLACLFMIAGFAAAEQLTTVAIIDIGRVYNTFYRDSRAVRELESLQTQYQREINRHVQELENLRDQRVRAADRDDDRRVMELDEEILQKTRFVEDLTRRRRQQLELRQQQLLSDDFLLQLQEAIQFVAEEEGYTVVLSSEHDGIQWWSPAVDITEPVVERLRQVES
ncbi:MAG: OmpH family outer membrane protein [Spirochaetaceae bacterium]